MSSLFDIGKSAIQSYRQALAVTGQNIANVNTDGYKRREADLKDCLLYTSPSPRDLSTSRMPSSA